MTNKAPKKLSQKKCRLSARLLAVLVSLYVHLCGYLTRYVYAGSREAAKIDNANQQAIYAFWHNQQGYLLFPKRRRGKIAVLVSMSKDGDYMAASLPHFKMTAVRGSSSRGGANAMRALIDAAALGYNPAITPDGPRGPVYKAHIGAIYLAQKTGLPILPAGVASSNKISFKSWDGFNVPLPFGKCALVYGEPVWVHKNSTDLEGLTNLLTDNLNKATAQAQELIK